MNPITLIENYKQNTPEQRNLHLRNATTKRRPSHQDLDNQTTILPGSYTPRPNPVDFISNNPDNIEESINQSL